MPIFSSIGQGLGLGLCRVLGMVWMTAGYVGMGLTHWLVKTTQSVSFFFCLAACNLLILLRNCNSFQCRRFVDTGNESEMPVL